MSSKYSFNMDSSWVIILVVLLASITTTLIMNHSQNGIQNSNVIEDFIDTDDGDLEINWNRFSNYDIELSNNLTITKSGVYHLTGSLIDQNVIVNVANGKIKLILDNVTIKNSTGPAIACYAADDLVIELVGENILEDGKVYSADYDEDVNSVVYSKADLAFEGEGSLVITANYQDGIVGKDDVKFSSGTYKITAIDDGIRGKDSVYIINGEFAITAKGDGIKSTNETKAGKGFVLVEDGNISIVSGDDGIHAYNNLVINGGTINIEKSYEGLEAQNIVINDGNINITSNDDGINAGGGSDSSTNTSPGGGAFDADASCSLTINGGNVYINASGDGVDSNGYVYFNGGDVIVDGPTNNGNGALDSGVGITQAGGTVIATGASGMAETLGASSSIYNASIYFDSTLPAGTEVKIKNSDGITIVRYTSAKSFSHMSVGTPDFKKSETYTIYVDGTEYKAFEISSITTIVGAKVNNNTSNGGMEPGSMPDDMPSDIPNDLPTGRNQPPDQQYRR